MIYCSAGCYHCCCTQTTPWLSSCYRPERRDWLLLQALCALTTGEKPDSSASLSLSVSAVGSSPAAGSLFPCRSVRKRRKALHDTEGIFCLYISLSPTSPMKVHRVPGDKQNLLLLCAVLRTTWEHTVALHITLKLPPLFPYSSAACHHTVLADIVSYCPFATAPP